MKFSTTNASAIPGVLWLPLSPHAREEARYFAHVVAVFRDALDDINLLQPRLHKYLDHWDDRRKLEGQAGTDQHCPNQHQQSTNVNGMPHIGI